MSQSRMLDVGFDVQTESIAVAYGAKDREAEGIYLDSRGTRQADIEQVVRQLPATAKHLVFVDVAGPCSDGLLRDLTKTGGVCWGMAPSNTPESSCNASGWSP